MSPISFLLMYFYGTVNQPLKIKYPKSARGKFGGGGNRLSLASIKWLFNLEDILM